MHSRGNYAPPVGQRSYAPIPSFHQRAHAPFPPPPSQGSQAPQTNVVQMGPRPVLPHFGQQGHPLFWNASPGPPQHGPYPPIPSSGINAQHYFAPPLPPPTLRPLPPPPHRLPPPLPPPHRLPPPPPPQSLQVNGSSHSQQHPPLIQEESFVPPNAPALTVRQTLHPLQAQTVYGGQLHQQTTPSSGFHAGTILPPAPQPLNMLATLPPPPPPQPSSPPGSPPRPPFSPSTASHEIVPSGTEYSRLGESASDFVGVVLGSSPTGDHASQSKDYGKSGELNGSEIDQESTKSLILNLSSPPPKPADARTLHNIELLCQSIAQNGLHYEHMILEREAGNPEFKFLFVDETGNENTIAHEYFLWLRKKCQLGLEADEKLVRGDSLAKQKETSSYDCKSFVPYSPVDSDMDMEDDITLSEAELLISSNIHQSPEVVVGSNEVNSNPSHMPNSSEGQFTEKDSLHENFVPSGSSGLKERPGSSSSSDHEPTKSKNYKADESVSDSLTEVQSQLDSIPCNLSPPHDDLYNATIFVAENTSENLSGQLIKEVSPFSLLQDYASDGSLNDEDRPGHNVPVTGAGSKIVLECNKELDPLGESCSKQIIVSSETEDTTSGRKDFTSNQEFVEHGSRHERLEEVIVQRDSRREITTQNMSPSRKVDEFGRLIREGGSESDSEGSPLYNKRPRSVKRDRSDSRSRSPHDRRRRSRSPHDRRRSPRSRKKRHGRSRSRSSSPKRRRNRSRSPPHGRGGEYGVDKTRRGKGVDVKCFDFIRGKCYRGASCRYMHHVDKSERSRSYKSQELTFSRSGGSDIYNKTETSGKNLCHHNDEGGVEEPLNARKDNPYYQEKQVLEESAGCLPEEVEPSELAAYPIPEVDTEKLPSMNLEPKQHEHSNANVQDEEMLVSSALESPPNCIPTSDPITDSSYTKKPGSSPMNYPSSSEGFPSQSSAHQESFPVVSETHALPTQQIPREPNFILPLPNHPSSSSASANFNTYQASVSYAHAQYPPPISFWNTRPPHIPPPFPMSAVNMTLPMSGVNMSGNLAYGQHSSHSVSTQTSAQPYTSDFSKVGPHQVYSSVQELNQPPHPWYGLQAKPIPVINQPTSQPHVGHELLGRDHFSGQALPELYPVSSIPRENSHSNGMPFSKEPFSSGAHAPGDTDIHVRNQQFGNSDFGASRIINHFNPYASTFERPMSSKFSSNLLKEVDRQYGSKYGGAAFSLNNPPLNGSGGANVGSKNLVSQQSSAEAVVSISPRPGGDQYDPLCDSLEPLSYSARKSDCGQKQETTGEADFRLRFSGSSKPLHIDEHSMKIGSGGLKLPVSLENNGADVEVDSLDIESSSNLNDATGGDTPTEEAEIGQVKAPGKKKKKNKEKSKDSRSMRLFKNSLASFVKDVLKTSWRQGNMSKEAFKTIVKKTVDKAAGAMKSHHIPKSQEKIDQFIDKSQRKLTKLVMGYVDKYVKV